MKSLVVYYSYSGNTKIIVDMIKNKIDCDVLKLEPKIPFSNDYDEVVKEYQNNNIDNKEVMIKDVNININEYDKIIIGTPVWWYTISPVVVTFLKKYNLDNKIIYPFATNAGWLGHTFNDFKKLCKNSIVNDGMNIVFKSYSNILKTDTKEIDEWINKINIKVW